MTSAVDLAGWLREQGFAPDDLEAVAANRVTPLMRAAQLGQAGIVAALIARGARLEARNADGNNALWLACVSEDRATLAVLIDAGIDLDNRNDNDATALMYAASSGRTAVVEQLLAAGADFAHESRDGFCALDMAANIECLRLLRAAQKRLAAQERA